MLKITKANVIYQTSKLLSKATYIKMNFNIFLTILTQQYLMMNVPVRLISPMK